MPEDDFERAQRIIEQHLSVGKEAIFLNTLLADARSLHAKLAAAHATVERLTAGLSAIRADWSGSKAWEHATGVLAAETALRKKSRKG